METELTEELRNRLNQSKAPDQLLLFLLSGLGDTLMFTPALNLLRLIWPKTRIVALTMRRSEYDILHTNPDLDEVLIWPFLKKNAFKSLSYLTKIRRQHYDLSILPCPSNRIHYNLIATICGAKQRAAFRYLKQSRRNLDFLNQVLIPHTDHVHNVEHNIQLVEKLSRISRDLNPQWSPTLILKTLPYDEEEALRFLVTSNLNNQSFIAFHISSSRKKHMERKCWPKENFLELARKFELESPDLHFLILCGDEDLAESKWLVEKIGRKAHIAQTLPIRTIAQILTKSRLLVTNDSGLLHVSCAMNVPTVALFGPTNPRRSGPWNARAEIVRMDLPCSPCFYHTSNELTCPAGLNFECIRQLPVENVAQAVRKLLRS
jgi:ADP-heptose:LPS heptosyltransferase